MPAFNTRHVDRQDVWGARIVAGVFLLAGGARNVLDAADEGTMRIASAVIGSAIGAYIIYFLLLKVSDLYLAWRSE